MPHKKLVDGHLQYLGPGQGSIFELRKTQEFLKSARDEMLDNLYAHRLEEIKLNSLSCAKLDMDQIPSTAVTLSLC